MSGGVYRMIESERLPPQVGPFEFHYSRRFEMAALACACGCGHRVMLNLLDQHHLVIEGGLPTVTPSILVSDAPCLSHFFIRRGQVEWAQQWSKKKVDMVMQFQVRRHVGQDKKRKPKPSFLRRSVDWFMSWFDR
jgi:hypothetical protein